MRWNRWLSLMVVSSIVLFSLSCRSRARSSKVSKDTVKVVIAMKHIDDVHQSKLLSLMYEIKCNKGEWTTGSLSDEEEQESEFFIKNLKTEDTCETRVLYPTATNDFEFLVDDRVMYMSRSEFEIGMKPGGQLFAEASMERHYRLRTGDAAVKVPIVFKQEMPKDANTLIAELKCSPEFEGLATGMTDIDRAQKKGVFVFEKGLKKEIEYQCRQIQVGRGKEKDLYFGDVKAAIKYKEGADTLLDPVDLVKVEITTASGVLIVTTPGEACKPGEIFDLEERRCKVNE